MQEPERQTSIFQLNLTLLINARRITPSLLMSVNRYFYIFHSLNPFFELAGWQPREKLSICNETFGVGDFVDLVVLERTFHFAKRYLKDRLKFESL